MSGSQEEKTIISILSDFLNKKEALVDADLDLDRLFAIAKTSEVSGIVYYMLSKVPGLDAEKLVPLQEAYAYTLFAYKNRMAVLNSIKSRLSEAQIPFFIFKGFEIAKFYPVPALRTMGDSDIMVRPQDRERAHAVFEALGLAQIESGPNEWVYNCKGLEFELHVRLMNESEAGNLDSHKAFMNMHWDYAHAPIGEYEYHLDESYHFVYLLLHLRKHFINSGVGIRQFMDLAVMALNCKLDWEFITGELSKMDLLEFAKIVLSQCKRWFLVESPLETQLDDAFLEDAIERIFGGGVFGYADEDNKENYRMLQLNKAGNTGAARADMALSTLFPSYDVMRAVKNYSFIDGKPYLLPIAWIWRAIRSLAKGNSGKALESAAKPLNISDRKVEERMEVLRQWKLL